ncbi:MAG: leucine-rich repeat domain-containing protein [Bacteroides sp.]|nr:leucine-rich repeat domain-containing protein [Bacteroides sp.]
MNAKNLLLGMLLSVGVGAYAHDFTATVNGQRLYFEITSKNKKTVSVTYIGSLADKKALDIAGIVEIPAKIKHNNVVYDVNAIGQKAFANADRLKGIVIPSGVETIGDFAFEDCDSLKSVVFPGNSVTIGQGVFFKCPQISDVTIGSDWKNIDFTMFRWSDNLISVTIPAKIEKIQGIKKLIALKAISVDPNNKKFTSYDGMLYNKNGSTLFACPRAYTGTVKVNEGVTKVLDGALIDCVAITSIDLPSTIQSISFRETSRMKNLENIILRSETPVTTGYINGTGRFFFQLANLKVILMVLASAKDKYLSDLATIPGEYSESVGTVPYIVSLSELPSKKNFKGVKNFDKY